LQNVIAALHRATQNHRVLKTSWHPYLNMVLKASFQVALQILLVMAAPIASWEKLILSYFRASRNQDRLCDLHQAYISIEGAKKRKLTLREITDEFASITTWKVLLLLECYSIYPGKGWIYWCFNWIVSFEHK